MKKFVCAVSAIATLCTVPSTVYASSASISAVTLKYPDEIFHTGSSGNYVKDIQIELKQKGFSSGAADGQFGPKTCHAVEAFQRAKKLQVTGKVTEATWDVLFQKVTAKQKPQPVNNSTTNASPSVKIKYPNKVFKRGSRGSYVKDIQIQLNKLGYRCGTPTGIFGLLTENGVKKFQMAKKIRPSGEVGGPTWDKLFAVATPTKSTSSGQGNTGGSSQTSTSSPVVDVFGGSMTYGYLDPQDISFVERAFDAYSVDANTKYTYMNYAIPGYTAQRFDQTYPGKYDQILQQDKPQVVVLAWGLENDMSSAHADSVTDFSQAIQQEIAAALAANAVVLLVTPPVTELLATTDQTQVETYIQALFQVGESFNSPDVIDFDVFHQMNMYMAANGETYLDFYGDGWHPNEAGHILAGQLLESDLQQAFNNQPIRFVNPVSY